MNKNTTQKVINAGPYTTSKGEKTAGLSKIYTTTTTKRQQQFIGINIMRVRREES